MFTRDQVPATLLDTIPDTDTDIPALVDVVTEAATRFAAERSAEQGLNPGAKADVFYGTCEALFNTYLDRIAELHGDDRAGRLAAALDSYLDRLDATA
ncbi:hypothetical protein [Glycomyces artemisiae]|uniref:Uncharacterized protein n=1 Tax=Glycomyces artemisiae TaxID=1076443 RepID=A0A2T0UF08_9ACTN|nr:hypothetical protein [Glycomyces artemisiae]PRY56407.1 hypothetical protein B0I28_10956 [Glycomyces artemisiae]